MVLGDPPTRTLEDTLKRLVSEKVFIRLERGKYYVSIKNPSDFEIAYFLCNPSYVSFETALSYHGILSQFPVEITSATVKRSNQKQTQGKIYTYSHIKKELFVGYQRVNDSLIADPKKALVDQIYFSIKGIKSTVNLNEYNLRKVNIDRVKSYSYILGRSYSAQILANLGEWL